VAGRILRVSVTFRRSVARLGVLAGSPAYRAVSAALRALASTEVPGAGDFETAFAPGRAFVRRVVGLCTECPLRVAGRSLTVRSWVSWSPRIDK
jgi:hypothetical protein